MSGFTLELKLSIRQPRAFLECLNNSFNIIIIDIFQIIIGILFVFLSEMKIKSICIFRKGFVKFLLRVIVYKNVSFKTGFGVESLNLKEKAQNWLKYSLNDPMVKTLSKNSNLTKIQLETLLIDVLAENISDKTLKYDEKARLRILSVSRGAFNRSLRQARRNVTQSIYTILLLGYLGILEEISLEPYIEAANKLKTYINTQQKLAKMMPKEEHIRTLTRLHEELKNSLEELSNPRRISKRL